jgi:hypothetical protein
MENKNFYSYLYSNIEPDGMGLMASTECIEARDIHFQCINEQSTGLEAKHSACPESFGAWTSHCPKGIRRGQALQRYLERRDELLYKNKNLNEYFKTFLPK